MTTISILDTDNYEVLETPDDFVWITEKYMGDEAANWLRWFLEDVETLLEEASLSLNDDDYTESVRRVMSGGSL